MRATVGILGILGLSVAVASAQAPRSSYTPQRRATLLPPQAIHPGDFPVVARAAAEELPNNPVMTPVVRQAGATAPGWLSGTDSSVRPAAGTGGNQSVVRPLTPRTQGAKDESSVVAKGIDKLKSFGKGGRPETSERAPGQLPPGVAAVAANANTAFRGTGTNGSPVYAGPPAYRWYGWGSVTPGANPYAPTGQHPPASANWFSITGATPGAFPVPVTHPDRLTPGTEPPVYVTAPNQRVVPNWNHASTNMPAHGFVRGADPVAHMAPQIEQPRMDPSAAPRPTPTPTITPPPPIALPAITPVPIVVPGTTDQEPPIRPVGTESQENPLPVVSPGETSVAPPTGNPTPLPVSVTDEKGNWQPTNDSNSSNEWGPADGKSKSHAAPRPVNWQQPGAETRTQGHPVARGQIEVSRPDPAIALIRNLCSGRASAVDVRWTGGEKLRVSFDCRTAAAAQQLVKDISARPELAPLQIEFSVLVK